MRSFLSVDLKIAPMIKKSRLSIYTVGLFSVVRSPPRVQYYRLVYVTCFQIPTNSTRTLRFESPVDEINEQKCLLNNNLNVNRGCYHGTSIASKLQDLTQKSSRIEIRV